MSEQSSAFHCISDWNKNKRKKRDFEVKTTKKKEEEEVYIFSRDYTEWVAIQILLRSSFTKKKMEKLDARFFLNRTKEVNSWVNRVCITDDENTVVMSYLRKGKFVAEENCWIRV